MVFSKRNFTVTKLWHQIVAGTLLLFLLGAQGTTCLAPSGRMSEQDEACCRQMADRCGDMNMRGNHPCCQPLTEPHRVAIVTDRIGGASQPPALPIAMLGLTLPVHVPGQYTFFSGISSGRL